LRQAWKKDAVSPRRYLAIRVRPRQGELLRDGNRVCHFCIVTNRSDPEGSSGLDLTLAPREGRDHRARPLQPALGLQARRPTRGISRRPTQAAALFAAQ
jgi:hypothetical protein